MKKHFKAIICFAFAMIIGLGFIPSIIAFAIEDTKSNVGSVEDNPVNQYLTNKSVLGYRYSPKDNYYYVDKENNWQKNFGYTRLYDLAAPYILLEYDYTRVHFTYKDIDWMVQLWKGQYGLMFYGAEVGVYTKLHSEEEDTYTTKYNCAGQKKWLKIQTTLYHDKKGDGNYTYEFETPYEKTWWSTGFKMGHLRQQEPATELRMVGTITLNDEEMTELFTKGLEDCGFKRVETEEDLTTDAFYVDGLDVHYIWQDNSEAENTMPIKTATGTLLFLNFTSVISVIFLLLLSVMALGFMGMIVLIIL